MHVNHNSQPYPGLLLYLSIYPLTASNTNTPDNRLHETGQITGSLLDNIHYWAFNYCLYVGKNHLLCQKMCVKGVWQLLLLSMYVEDSAELFQSPLLCDKCPWTFISSYTRLGSYLSEWGETYKP